MKSKSKIENTEFYRYLKSEFKITEELLEKLISNFQRKDYKKGEHILLKGETENTIKFVENGIVHQYRIGNKKPVTINIAIPKMIFNSFTSYALQEPSSQQQTAVNAVTLYDILSKPLKCGYNPYTGEWSDWSTNPLKQKAIEFYGIDL